jgi:hypothetical protein
VGLSPGGERRRFELLRRSRLVLLLSCQLTQPARRAGW